MAPYIKIHAHNVPRVSAYSLGESGIGLTVALGPDASDMVDSMIGIYVTLPVAEALLADLTTAIRRQRAIAEALQGA